LSADLIEREIKIKNLLAKKIINYSFCSPEIQYKKYILLLRRFCYFLAFCIGSYIFRHQDNINVLVKAVILIIFLVFLLYAIEFLLLKKIYIYKSCYIKLPELKLFFRELEVANLSPVITLQVNNIFSEETTQAEEKLIITLMILPDLHEIKTKLIGNDPV
jgi:hypothetical protein